MRDVRLAGGMWCVFVLCFACVPCVQAGEAPAPHVKLSEGEVIEMAAGEVLKAAALYREVLADPNAQGPVRARALYLLARCERKLGNLKSAEDLLQEVTAKHSDCAPFKERAAKMLTEIRDAGRSGAGEWLQGLKENESIQAQLFQMTMTLFSPESDEGKLAAGKLLAMGPLAQPVLRTVMQTTRDPQYRRQLALILAKMGDFEALDTVCDPLRWRSGIGSFLDAVASFDAEKKREFRAALDKLPATSETEEVRALCAVFACDGASLDASLTRVEKSCEGPSAGEDFARFKGFLESMLLREPQTAAVMVARVRDPTSTLASACFYALLDSAPAALTPEVLLSTVDRFGKDSALLLLERKDYGNLVVLLERAWASDQAGKTEGLYDHTCFCLGLRVQEISLPQADSSLGGVIRSMLREPNSFLYSRVYKHIISFFLHHDAALPELEKIIRYEAANDLTLDLGRIMAEDAAPRPSDAFLALIRTLAVDPDAKVRTFVLRNYVGLLVVLDPALIQVLGRYLDDPAVALPEKRSLVYEVLVKALDVVPAHAGEIAAILVKDYASAREVVEKHWVNRRSGLALAEALLERLEGDVDAAFYKLALRWAVSGPKRVSVRTVQGITMQPRGWPVRWTEETPEQEAELRERLTSLCARAIEKHTSGPKRMLLARIFCDWRDKDYVLGSPTVSAFLDRIVADRSLPLAERAVALPLRVEATPVATFGEFLTSDDKEVQGCVLRVIGRMGATEWLKGRPHDEEAALIGHLARGPHKEHAITLANNLFDGEERVKIVETLLTDEDPKIRKKACESLRQIKIPRVTALLTARLKDDNAEIRELAIRLLGGVGGLATMESLAAMLDDPVVDVRKAALDTLRNLKEQEVERELWKKWLQDRQNQPAEAGSALPKQP